MLLNAAKCQDHSFYRLRVFRRKPTGGEGLPPHTQIRVKKESKEIKIILEFTSKTFEFVKYTLFFISNTFISNARLKLVENQADTKQHPEAELFLYENYSHSTYLHPNYLSTLSSKNNRTYSTK